MHIYNVYVYIYIIYIYIQSLKATKVRNVYKLKENFPTNILMFLQNLLQCFMDQIFYKKIYSQQ